MSVLEPKFDCMYVPYCFVRGVHIYVPCICASGNSEEFLFLFFQLTANWTHVCWLYHDDVAMRILVTSYFCRILPSYYTFSHSFLIKLHGMCYINKSNINILSKIWTQLFDQGRFFSDTDPYTGTNQLICMAHQSLKNLKEIYHTHPRQLQVVFWVRVQLL